LNGGGGGRSHVRGPGNREIAYAGGGGGGSSCYHYYGYGCSVFDTVSGGSGGGLAGLNSADGFTTGGSQDSAGSGSPNGVPGAGHSGGNGRDYYGAGGGGAQATGGVLSTGGAVAVATLAASWMTPTTHLGRPRGSLESYLLPPPSPSMWQV
jgi:hypothetical protein